MCRSPIIIRAFVLVGLIGACSGGANDSTRVARSRVQERKSNGEVTAPAAPKHATPAELDDLRAELIIPLARVTPGELHDTYHAWRGLRIHEALDIMAPRGTPVLSAADGRLLKRIESKAGGLMVYAADASDRFILMYAHLNGYADGMTDGMPLHRGDVIGFVGSTGNAAENAPHLHFAIARGQPSVAWWKGSPVNPYPLLVPRN